MHLEYGINTNKHKRGFTLAEVMVVLLVLTVLLAVFAPFITKRKRTNTTANLWSWSTRNYLAGPMDIYFNPEDANSPSLFIGMTPDSASEIADIYEPLGKVIIRGGYINHYSKDDDNNIVSSGKIQHQIHLRHGLSSNSTYDPDFIGYYGGSILMDGENILVGAKYDNMKPKQTDNSYPKSNVAFGYSSLNNIGDRGEGSSPASYNVALGYSALQELVSGKNNTAIGASSSIKNKLSSGNTTIGYNSGYQLDSGDNTNQANYNTLIGYKSTSGTGNYNTFIGAETGPQVNYPTKNFSNNTAVGYKALSSITSGEYNTALGAYALKNLQGGSYNVAIGYNACSNLTNQSYKTCIGYNSGPASDSGANAELGIGVDDQAQRTYIGTNPNMESDGSWPDSLSATKYGGDAVLEIHNVGGTNDGLINNPDVKSNTTTIINGNLVVKGRTFLTIGKVLFPFYYNSQNIFGTIPDGTGSEACTNSQNTYAFVNSGKCANLSNISSDRRLKNIGSKFKGGLDEINKLKIYNYTFKDDKENNPHTGVLAQELQKVFPNSVFEDEKGYLSIRWDEMFYSSINAIKDLNKRISALIKQTLSLESQIEKLEKDNKELKSEIDNLTLRIKKLKTK